MSRPVTSAWITGASHGIGRALAEQLAAEGATVAVSARGSDSLQQLQAENEKIKPYPLDVTDEAAVESIFEHMASDLGLPDLVVLGAGIYEPVAAQDASARLYREHMQVNYLGVTNCLAAVIPRMLARGSGQLVIIGSVAGYRGLPKAAAYGPTKAALISLAETLRVELQGSGIDVRLVNPGFVATRLTDKNNFSMPATAQPK